MGTKPTDYLWLCGIAFAVTLIGCSHKHVTVERFANGYWGETTVLSPATSEIRVWHDRPDGSRRLVTKAIIENKMIIYLLPTPVGWGCTGWVESQYMETVNLGGLGDTRGSTGLTVSPDGRLTVQQLAMAVNPRPGATSPPVVLEVGLPLHLEVFRTVLSAATKNPGGLAVVYAGHYPAKTHVIDVIEPPTAANPARSRAVEP
jgi:hypothetical protein